MVTEIAIFDVTDAEAFTTAYLSVREVLVSTPGCRSVRMTRGVESPDRFVLLAEWDSVADHEDNFRGSDRFKTWRAAIGQYFANPPIAEHFTDVG